MQFSVIIACHKPENRGLNRLILCLESLQNQTYPIHIYLATSARQAVADRFSRVKQVVVPLSEINLPKLMNGGGRAAVAAGTDYVHFTGIDFVYKSDYFEKMRPHLSPGKFFMSPVYMGAKNAVFTSESIRDWTGWPLRDTWGALAPGIQTFHRVFFSESEGYDEGMAGWSGMDDDMIYRARNYGLSLNYVPFREIYHIWHPNFKQSEKSRAQSTLNWSRRDKYKNSGHKWRNRK